MMNIVLVEPEIPQNTGNIARTCAVTGSSLHLVRPLGFSTDDKYLKRAGLDYWHLLDIHYYDSLAEFIEKHGNNSLYFTSTKAKLSYDEIDYSCDDYLVFGKETAGLPEELLQIYLDRSIRVPMVDDARSINLSNTVAIVLYEALRQLSFPGLKKGGIFDKK